MKLIQSKVRYKVYGHHRPTVAILHHTAGGRKGSEDYLRVKGLGYHYMIEKDGTVYGYNDIEEIVGHASKANDGYVGISYISGGPLGPTNDIQIQASIELLKELRSQGVTKVSDHATIDKIVAFRGWKSDPHWQGEKSEVNNWTIKRDMLQKIADESGLTPIHNTKLTKALGFLPINCATLIQLPVCKVVVGD